MLLSHFSLTPSQESNLFISPSSTDIPVIYILIVFNTWFVNILDLHVFVSSLSSFSLCFSVGVYSKSLLFQIWISFLWWLHFLQLLFWTLPALYQRVLFPHISYSLLPISSALFFFQELIFIYWCQWKLTFLKFSHLMR